MSEQNTTFTDADILFAESHPVLGPEYSAARSFMEKFMVGWEDEHLKPLADAIAKEVADKIRDRVWDDFRDHLLSDTEQNAAGAMRGMVHDTVKALLGGKRWALDRYPMAERYDADEIRAAIAKHIPDEIAAARIADLEAELKKARDDLEWMRR
jgi:hypothetical protein